jgi:hypothetical protein
MNIETKNKKSKDKISKINKKEFYFFIEENISPNYLNLLIKNKEKSSNNNKKTNKKPPIKQKTLKEKQKLRISNNEDIISNDKEKIKTNEKEKKIVIKA